MRGVQDGSKGESHAIDIAMAFLHLLASQISLRLVNFGLNLLIARHLSPEAYGVCDFVQSLAATPAVCNFMPFAFSMNCSEVQVPAHSPAPPSCPRFAFTCSSPPS
eukprot:scaffold198973_cov21-Tisochrysis_lutea.AAC.1